MDSLSIINSDSESINTYNTQTEASSSNITSINSDYNDSNYKLKEPPKTGIYIFDNGLYTRTLQPVDFTKERQILIKCALCNFNKITTIKGFQSSNYVQHYRNKHPTIAYNKATESTKTKLNNLPSTNDFFNISFTTDTDSRKRARNNTLTDFNDDEAYNKILNFIIENNLSFNILNSSTFKDLLSYYNRLTPIINRKKIKLILDKNYNTELLNLINDIRRNIESNGTFSLIFDLWTSNNQDAFFGIILSYINSDFKLKYKLIGFEHLTESHTAEYIYNEFLQILKSYKFLNITSNNILSITRDNASNNNKFLSILRKKNNSINDIRCSAHIINIIVQDILSDYILHSKNEYVIDDNNNDNNNNNNTDVSIITKVRKLATLIKYTAENKKLLLEGINKYKKECLIPLNYNKTRIPLDNATRWNSTYNMISTTLELKEPLIYINKITKNTDFKRYFLSDNEFEELIELKKIFEVFIKPTTKLQGELYITLNITLLYIYQIYNKLDNLINIYKSQRNIQYNSYIIAIKRGIEKLEKYFPRRIISSNIRSLKVYILTLILDPRFKLIHFQNNGLLLHYKNIYNDAISILQFEYIKLRNELNLNNNNNITNPNISFDELAMENTTICSNNSDNNEDNEDDEDDDIFISKNLNKEEEYTEYIKESTISNKDINPLDYWKQNSYRFPILSILARRYLAIPATSASIERIFSISNNIITKSRNRLLPNTIKQLILLKNWRLQDFKKLNIEEEEFISEEEEEEEEEV